MVGAGGILGGGPGAGSGMAPQGFVNNEAEEEAPNVSEEEQQQYNTFVQNGMEILYTEEGEVQPEVLKRLSTGKKPIDTLAQTTVWLVMMLEQSAKQDGLQITDDVMLHGSKELFEQLVEIGEATKLHEFKEAELQGAWYNALDMYREANSDEGDRFNKEEAAAAFEALNEADKEGRADEIIPGFYQQSERAMTMAMQDGNPVQEEDAEGGDEKVMNARDRGSVRG